MTADTGTNRDVRVAEPTAPAPAWPVYTLAVLAIGWLAAVLWLADTTITGFGGGELLAVSRAALVLPTVASASIVAGAALGLAAIELAGTRFPVSTTPARLVVGGAAGLVAGLLEAVLILTGYGTGSSLVVLAGGVGAAALIGGVASAARPDGIVGAAVAGTLAWFLLGLVQGALNDRLLHLFGAGTSAASRVHATSRLLLAVALTGGILVGLVAYRYLRPRAAGLHWPVYLAAGAGPGLLLLVANAVAYLGGARLRQIAAASSDADRAALHYVSSAGMNTALVLLFLGAITAMIAYGRTLRPADPAP